MNLYLRLIIVMIGALFKKRMAEPTETGSLDFTVLPNDLDLNGHMNNGRYPTLMDLGRVDLILRMPGLMRYARKNGYIPVLASSMMRFRVPLFLFQKYTLTSRILCWDERWVYMEQRFLIRSGKKAGAVAAIGLVKTSFFSPRTRGTVPTADILGGIGLSSLSPPMPDYIAEWAKAEDILRVQTAQDV